MSEIALSQAPAHLRHGSNMGQPLTRREGVLKVTGRARFAADNHPPGMLYAVLAVSSIARGRVAFLDVAGREGASRRRRGHDAIQPAAARAGSGHEDEPLHVSARRPAKRPCALREPADRGRDRRDPRGRDGRRRAALAPLRDRAGPGRPRLGREFRSPRHRDRQSGRGAAGQCRGGAGRGLAAHRSDLRDVGPVPQRDGAARDRRRMGRREAVHRHAESGSRAGAGTPRRIVRNPDRRTFISAVPSSAAGSVPKA